MTDTAGTISSMQAALLRILHCLDDLMSITIELIKSSEK